MKFFFAMLILAAICAAVFGCASNPTRVYLIAVPDETVPVEQRPDYARRMVHNADGSTSLLP